MEEQLPPRGRCTLVFKGGQSVVLTCRSAEVTKSNVSGAITGITIDGLTEKKFLYLRLEDISGVFWHEEGL